MRGISRGAVANARNRFPLAESAPDRKSASESQPPETGAIAKAGLQVAVTGQTSKAPGLVELLFDSLFATLPRARSSGSEIRQMLYRARPYQ